jgi:nucleoside-diphosphate-sugar epimerase
MGDLLDNARSFCNDAFDVVFHLASATSAECEANFDLGLKSNLDATRALLDSLRAAGNVPRLVFASSLAVFGREPNQPSNFAVHEGTPPAPKSSYGIQKFIGELLVSEYTRKGFLDGRTARIMTVVVRATQPNGAASGFLSSIVREPLNGRYAKCPVPPEASIAVSSPDRTIDGLITMAELDRDTLCGYSAVNLPALTVTVQEMLDALESFAGTCVREKVLFAPDEHVARIVRSWPALFDNTQALRLGLKPDPTFKSIISQFVAEPA